MCVCMYNTLAFMSEGALSVYGICTYVHIYVCVCVCVPMSMHEHNLHIILLVLCLQILNHKSKALELVQKCAPDTFNLETLANRTQNFTK